MNHSNLPAKNFFVLVNRKNRIVEITDHSTIRNLWIKEGKNEKFSLWKLNGGDIHEAIEAFNEMSGEVKIIPIVEFEWDFEEICVRKVQKGLNWCEDHRSFEPYTCSTCSSIEHEQKGLKSSVV